MITSALFANSTTGQRLGNQLFQLASLIGMARRYDTQLVLPDCWTYKECFVLYPCVEWEAVHADLTLREPTFACALDHFDAHAVDIRTKCVDIRGFLQSENYWKESEPLVRKALSFRQDIDKAAKEILAFNGINMRTSVAISVRRGDFTTDANHVLLPASYYEKAYRSHFNGQAACFFSDDCPWCEQHLAHLTPDSFLAHPLSPILQLACMSQFRHFVIANSTFSWWGAYLSPATGKVVVRPKRHFSGTMAHTDISDHYPEDWIAME